MPNVEADTYYPVRRNLVTGMNSKNHPTLIGATEAQYLLNADLTMLGKTRKRDGFVTAGDNPSASVISGMARFNPTGGSDVVLAQMGTDLTYWDGGASWAASIHTLTAADYTKIVVANDKAFIFNGQDNVHTVDSSYTVTDLGAANEDPTNTPVACYFKDRIFCAAAGIVYFSGVGDNTFDRSANMFRVNTGDNDAIMALVPFRSDELIIFKEHSIWQLYCPGNTDPLNDWWLRPIDMSTGCISYDAAVQVGDDIHYWAEDGVRSLRRNEQDKVVGVSTPISDPIFTGYVDTVNYAYKTKIRGVYYPQKNMVVWAVPYGSSTVCNYWFVYHVHGSAEYNGWSIWKSEKSGAFTNGFVRYLDSGREKLYFSNSGTGQLYEMFSGDTDDGEGIEFDEIGRMEDLTEQGLEANEKYGLSMFVKTGADADSVLDVTVQVDEEGWVDIGDVSMDVSAPELPETLPFYLTDRQITITKLSLDSLEHWYNIQYRLHQAATSSYPLEVLERMFVCRAEAYQTS